MGLDDLTPGPTPPAVKCDTCSSVVELYHEVLICGRCHAAEKDEQFEVGKREGFEDGRRAGWDAGFEAGKTAAFFGPPIAGAGGGTE